MALITSDCGQTRRKPLRASRSAPLLGALPPGPPNHDQLFGGVGWCLIWWYPCSCGCFSAYSARARRGCSALLWHLETVVWDSNRESHELESRAMQGSAAAGRRWTRHCGGFCCHALTITWSDERVHMHHTLAVGETVILLTLPLHPY